MEGLKLITLARQRGLEVKAEGSKLVIRGPRSLEPLAKSLLERKSEVLEVLRGEELRPISSHGGRSPYLTQNGVLVIPFDSPERFHWWNGGQDILETLKCLGANESIIRRYVPGWDGRRNRFGRN